MTKLPPDVVQLVTESDHLMRAARNIDFLGARTNDTHQMRKTFRSMALSMIREAHRLLTESATCPDPKTAKTAPATGTTPKPSPGSASRTAAPTPALK